MRGKKLTEEQRERVLDLYTKGCSYGNIEADTGVSKASISSLVQQAERTDPNLSGIRSVAVWCKKNHRAPETLSRAIRIEQVAEKAGIGLDELEKNLVPFLMKFGKDAVEIAEKGKAYAELVGPKGLTFEELLAEREKLEKGAKDLNSEIQEQKRLLASIENTIYEKKQSLEHLGDLEKIYAVLKKIGKDPGEAKIILQKSEELLATGLTLEVLVALGREFQARGMDPKSAPAEIAEAVRRSGSLRQEETDLQRKVKLLRAEELNLMQSIEEKQQRVKQLTKKCTKLAKDESRLRKRYDLSITEYRRIEEEHRATLEKLTDKTKQECETMMKNAKNEAEKAREDAEAARKNASLWETRAEQKKQEVMAAKLLVGYLVKKDPVRFEQIKALYQAGGAYSTFPLPEDLRNYFVQAVGNILTEDAKARLREVEQEAKRKKEEAEKILKDAFAISQNTERKVKLVLGFENARKYVAEDFEAVVQVLTSEPTILGEIIGGLSDARLFNIFLSLPQRERTRFKQILHYAEAHAKEQEQKAFNEWFNEELAKLKANMVRELTTSGVQVIPQDMVAVAAAVNAAIVDEPVIENGKVKYDQFGLPKRRLRIVRQGIK